jgi:undecaprenyl pyrophosphate phosphatase UppP
MAFYVIIAPYYFYNSIIYGVLIPKLKIMITKHFFKTLLIFTVMIIFGLFGLLAVSSVEKKSKSEKIENTSIPNTKAKVAK